MPGGITVKVEGLKGLDAALRELVEQTSGRTGKAVIKRAMVAAAQPMADRMAALAPKGAGELAASIMVASNGKQVVGKAAYAAAKRGGADDQQALKALRDAQRDGPVVAVLVGPSQDFGTLAYRVEFGVKPHVINPKKGQILKIWRDGQIVGVAHRVQHPGSRPHPFMRPAFEQTASVFIAELKTALAAQIAKAAARARSKSSRL